MQNRSSSAVMTGALRANCIVGIKLLVKYFMSTDILPRYAAVDNETSRWATTNVSRILLLAA